MKKIRTHGDPRVFLLGTVIICIFIGCVALMEIERKELVPNVRQIMYHINAIFAVALAIILMIEVNSIIPTEVEFDSEHISKKHLMFRRSIRVSDITSVKCRIIGNLDIYVVEIKISSHKKNLKIFDEVITNSEYMRIMSGNSKKEIMELHNFLNEICPEKMTNDWEHLYK